MNEQTSSQNNDMQLSIKKEGKGMYIVKLFVYLLFGLFGVIGFVIAGLWIKFKTKENKKSKFVALLIGLILLFVIPYGISIYVSIKYPETKIVKEMLSNKFPNRSISMGVVSSKKWISGEKPVTSKVLVVRFKSKEFMSGSEMINMGKSVCATLSSRNTIFNSISIRNLKSPVYPFSMPFVSMYFNASGTCTKWNNPQFAQRLDGMSSFAQQFDSIGRFTR